MKYKILSTDVNKELFIPKYNAIPMGLKGQAIAIMGFHDSSCFLRKNFISKEQYDKLVEYSNEHDLISNNRIVDFVPVDKQQLEIYNKRLLLLINSTEWINYSKADRPKIVDEQIRIQRILNKSNN